MTQALMNLVDNAMRHTSDGDGVGITARRSGDEAVVTVTNQGRPIPSEELPRVFERFYRARDASVDGRHAGLGLAIVKAIVEASGGSVSATSDRSGTRFSIRMPVSA
jgi:signal transduction histidine kinase